jgi:hypothetical protein
LFVRDAFRKYRTLLHRRPKFAVGLIAVFAVGVLLEIAGSTDLAHVPSHDVYRQFLSSFGDALIVAAVLAALVDPIVQHQFASEWGRDLYWAIFSPNAPQEFRDGLQALAAPTAYISLCQYTLTFSYPAGGLGGFYELDWRIMVKGEVLDRRGYRLADRVFVVPRHDGSPTDYCLWRFDCDDGDPLFYDEDELTAMGALSVDLSGRTVLDQAKITGIERLPFKKKYSSERHLLTSRWAADYIPLFQPRIVLRQVIVVRGAPVSELEFTVAQLGGAQVALTTRHRENGEVELRCELGAVSFPGQATMLTWKPKRPVPPESEPPQRP